MVVESGINVRLYIVERDGGRRVVVWDVIQSKKGF
jgi:hypothetical protein